MKYRKKPVLVEALQVTPLNIDLTEVFVGGDASVVNGELIIATLEGPLHASVGDWIIKGIKGEFYACKPDIFEATYEPEQTNRTLDKTFSTMAKSSDAELLKLRELLWQSAYELADELRTHELVGNPMLPYPEKKAKLLKEIQKALR